VPTFIVGHMSGQNWDPPWRAGRDLLSDVWLVGRHPAVAGWLVSNEMPLYGGDRTPHETVAAWAQIIRDAVRAAGGRQPFSTGDGAWGVETSGRDNGFRLADLAQLCDFLGPHVYPAGDDQVRQHYAAAWQCELAGTFGKPVVLEEFGVSSDFASGPNAARYYRHVLYHSLLAGATGWIAWNNTDFDLPGPAGAEVIATDARGRPALLLRRTGPQDRGSLILGTYPVEHMAALTPRVNPDDTVTLYRALATHAGARRPVAVDDPRIACDSLVRDDGTTFAVLASHAAEPLAVQPVLAAGQTLDRVTMAPFGINVLEVTAAGATDLSGAG